MNARSAHRLGFALALPALAASPMAVGQGAGLEEIIVTARQREERLQDVPASITAFTEVTLERAGIERAEDFVRLTPGLVMTNNVEVGDTAVSIRGVNKARDGEANFAFLIDGILLTNPSAFNREFDGLQQIEVVKGPQSALYGRSAVAGAIIVSTEKPSNEFDAGVSLKAGSDSTYYAAGYVSGPLLENQLYGRLHVDYRTTDGQYHDDLQDKDIIDDLESYNINGRLLWEPSENLTVDAKVRYGEVPDAGAIRFNLSFGFFENVNDHNFVWQQNIDPLNEQESLETSIKIDYDFGWATVTAWALYSEIEELVYADGSAAGSFTYATEPNCIASTAARFAEGVVLPPPSFLGPTPFTSALLPPYGPTTCDGYQTNYRDQDDVSFEFRLTSPDDQRLRWQVGMYYLSVNREYGLGQGLDIGDDRIVRDLFVPARVETLIHSDFDTEVVAGFGQFAYDVMPEVELSIALRWDQEDRTVANLVPPPSVALTQFVDFLQPADGIPGGSPLNPAFGFLAGQLTETVPDRSKKFDEWQPRISLTWDVNDQLTAFASWGVGFKSGGFNATGIAEIVDLFINQPIGSRALDVNDVFQKEVSNAFEVGFKSTLADGRVQIEGALFHTLVDDMQFFEFITGPFGLLRTVTTIDEVSITGGELAGNAQVTERWSVFGGASVVNGKIDKHRGRPASEGNEVPYAPKWTATFGSEYLAPSVWEGIDFVGRLDWSLVGETWFHVIQDQNSPTIFGFPGNYANTKRKTYDTINLRAGFEASNWGVAAFVRNLLDERYLDEVIPSPELGGSFVSPGLQRAWGFEFNYRFQ